MLSIKDIPTPSVRLDLFGMPPPHFQASQYIPMRSNLTLDAAAAADTRCGHLLKQEGQPSTFQLMPEDGCPRMVKRRDWWEMLVGGGSAPSEQVGTGLGSGHMAIPP